MNRKGIGRLILVLGGARSGKSRFAQEYAWAMAGENVLYVATATVTDEEMTARVERHREDRPTVWETVELPLRVGETLIAREALPPVILLDCLTLLLSTPAFTNADLTAAEVEAHATAEVDGLVRLAAIHTGALIVVSNEVGMGMHPDYPIGRVYRDAFGRANQRIAAHADEAYFLLAGIPLDLTKLRAVLPAFSSLGTTEDE